MRLRDASSRSRRHRPRPRGQVVLAQAIAAHQRFRTDSRCAFAIPGKHLDHPAGVAAVLCRRRAAQHFDAIGGIEAEGRCLTLAIRGQAGMPSAINFRPRTQRPSARRSRAMRSADPARNSGDFAPPAPAPG